MKNDYSLKSPLKYKIVGFDSYILIAYILLCLMGLYMNLNISSVTEPNMSTFMKQLLWVSLSLITMFYAFTVIDIKKLHRYIPLLTFINIILLVLVLQFGAVINGARRSFVFFGMNFQPSIFVRVMLVLYFVYFLDKKQDLIDQTDPKGFIKYFKPLIVVSVITFAIILKQQHFSTIVISAMTLMSLLWISKIRLSTIAAIILIVSIGFIGILSYGASYRESRMDLFKKYSLIYRIINKDVANISVDDYQVKQSLISMVAGGLFGTSHVYGQAKHFYLPESRTDYIYSIIGEEYGFIGAMVVFILYCVILFRGLLGSLQLKDLFLKLAVIGLTLNIFFNAFVNIGVAMAALPSTGVTLPFMSYGGTSLIANSLSIGLILNITAERRAC
ncbi:MAG: FtsW/RodA/SpoVE family cell cycle protein [Candidatus Cloacimonetes bacterium]|nr:FtsW/RodA/SpoVE family cell cycle protein [Candidatus Cloacimonadota bacterium]